MPGRVFVTGGSGFVGSAVIDELLERGYAVNALVNRRKIPTREGKDLGLVNADLFNAPALEVGMAGCDAVIHGAAIYEVGIPKSDHAQMYEANVRGTEHVMRAALDGEIPRVVYVSTVGAFGNTNGEVVDESYDHPGGDYTSYYEETKVEAHHIVWWERGGRTDLDNLTLVCTFHHRLVHEFGWSIERDPTDGAIGWLRPDGTRYRAGPAPPEEVVA